jgi:hypothetical protein
MAIRMTTATTPTSFPIEGAASTPRVLGVLYVGRDSFCTAEWPGKNASGPGHESEATERVLSRLGKLVGYFDEHVPERSFGGNRDERQPVALLARDGIAGGFSPLVNEGVFTAPGGLIPGSVSHDRHS